MLTIAGAALPPSSTSVSAVRALVGEVTSHLPRRAREAAELVASELATNSIVHARTDFEVFAAADDLTVELVVADRAGWTAPSDRAGHGLLLVGLLAREWSTESEGDGKKIWARLLVDDVPLS